VRNLPTGQNSNGSSLELAIGPAAAVDLGLQEVRDRRKEQVREQIDGQLLEVARRRVEVGIAVRALRARTARVRVGMDGFLLKWVA
jgi:hypothetical protein